MAEGKLFLRFMVFVTSPSDGLQGRTGVAGSNPAKASHLSYSDLEDA
jgi:hypothetical protein